MKKILVLLMFVLGTNMVIGQAPSLKGWHHMDLAQDSVPGISSNKAYAEILKGRKSTPVIVAVIDGGVDYMHEDLKDIMWHNPGEIPGDGIDNDKNGYIDDVYGWNFIGGKDGRNVNQDNLEVTRLYRKYDYKYKNADPAKLNKKQKKEYDLYLKTKEIVEKERKSAAEKLEKFSMRKESLFKSIDAVADALKKNNLTFEQMDSLKFEEGSELASSIMMIKRIAMTQPDLSSFDAIKEYLDKQFKGAIDYYSAKVLYQYNVDFDPRNIVGDNYEDSSERYYGNNDVKGPDASHGTHVSGIIAAVRNNGIGMNGIADNVKIMAVRVVPDGDERDKDVANGIRYAADNGAKIINMSFGKAFKWDKKVVDKAVRYAEKKGVLLIHAAGNDAEDNDKIIHYPSDNFEKRMWFCRKNAKNWLEIGANSYKNDSMFVAGFSNYGKKNVDLFAPGVSIYSTTPENNYASYNGTSMATPVVAGVAAVLKSYFPKLSASQMKEIIMDSVQKKNMKVIKPGSDGSLVDFSDLCVTGGEVNLYNALMLAIQKYGNKAAK